MGKHPVQSLFESSDFEVRCYSGRGMRGKECVGVVVESFSDFSRFVFEVGYEFGLSDDSDGYDAFNKAIGSMQSDAMGLNSIIYFPNVPFFTPDAQEDA